MGSAIRVAHVFAALGAAAVGLTSCDRGPTQPTPPKLVFITQPSAVADGQAIPPIRVAMQDAAGNTLTTSTDRVTLSLVRSSARAATLSGTLTVTAVQGIATFNDLRVSGPGAGYSLVASTPRFVDATSDPFAVTLALVAVSLGERHTCGTTIDGEGYCWGSNVYGSLGYSPTGPDDRFAPGAVAGGLTFASIYAGFLHSCGLTKQGAAYCWGHNASGEVGDGTTTDRTAPSAVAGGLAFVALSTAGDHTCGLTTSRTAYCWGANASGKLGDGTATTRTNPVAVTGGLVFSTLSVGPHHSCGVTVNGAAYCWGYNFHGQLGDGTTTDRWSPVPVLGGLTFAAITAGAAHTCGVTTSGAAYCWGENSFGQLGNEAVIDRTSPEAVRAAPIFTSLSAGAQHTCGVTSEGQVFCWGRNAFGELGDGTRTDRSIPTRVALGGAGRQPRLSTGAYSTCVVTEGYAAFCWGSNVEGQLGDGTQIDRLTPERVGPPARSGS
jgi:alpha-tubulin suppressor-like RCC1 family protein